MRFIISNSSNILSQSVNRYFDFSRPWFDIQKYLPLKFLISIEIVRNWLPYILVMEFGILNWIDSLWERLKLHVYECWRYDQLWLGLKVILERTHTTNNWEYGISIIQNEWLEWRYRTVSAGYFISLLFAVRCTRFTD